MPKSCFICGDANENRLQTHHIVPRRFGGSDEEENLVTLCASCHQAVEKLYDSRFYRELGISRTPNSDVEGETCLLEGCTADASISVESSTGALGYYLCDGHTDCGHRECSRSVDYVAEMHPDEDGDGEVILACSKHRVCKHSGCKNEDTHLVYTPSWRWSETTLRCSTHATEYINHRENL